MRPFSFVADGHYWGYCDRCSFKVRNDHLKVEWTGLLCCDKTVNNCWEPRNEQDFVRGIPDRQTVFPVRDYDPGNMTIDYNATGFKEARSGIACSGCSRSGTYYNPG